MHTVVRKFILSLSLSALAGCDLKPEVVGATLPDAGSGEGTTGGSTSGDTIGDTGSSDLDTSPTTGPGGDGEPCELRVESVEEGQPGCTGDSCSEPDYGGGPIVVTDLACTGDICIFAGDVESKQCEGAEDCAGDERFAGCEEGLCAVKAAWGAAHTGCTRTCEADGECPSLPGCVAGPVCTAVALLGSLCCEKVCACRDELSEQWLSDRETDCASGKYCQ